jgi:hypothetical protein
MRDAPQRIAYERVVRGDPDALALLKDRIVVVGTLLAGSDRQPLPWPADDRWGVELFTAQVDAMARDVAIVRLDPIAEWALMTGLALLGGVVGHRMRERSRATRVAVLATIAIVWMAAAVAWYRATHQLIGVPYDVVALASAHGWRTATGGEPRHEQRSDQARSLAHDGMARRDSAAAANDRRVHHAATAAVVATAAPRTSPDVARLDGIVADGNRAVQGREPGWITVTRDGVRQDGYAGFDLRRGDLVETGPRAHAVIRYPSGTEVLMRPSSGGRIGSLTEFFGEVFVKVKGLFSVDTTFVKAGARGTAYLVRTYAGGTTGITVVEGAVEVGSTTGAWPSVTIGAGTATLAHPRAPLPTAANLEDLAQHARMGSARRAARSAATRRFDRCGRWRGCDRSADRGNGGVRRATTAIGRHGHPPSRGAIRHRRHRRRVHPMRRVRSSPVSRRAREPTLDCRRGVALRWAAVGGARDYVVTFEAQRDRSWRAAASRRPRRDAGELTAPALAYENRWSVRARGAGDGPPSQTLYFRCDFSGVR